MWATGTAGSEHEEYYLVVQGDGNIVLYDDTLPEGEKAQWNLWGMIPSTNKAVRLELENDGRLVARNNYTGNTPKGDAIWVSRPEGYLYGRPDSVKFNIMYKYNVDLNIDKNPFGLELEYSITDGTNTYKSNENGEISIPNTTNANY